MLQAVLCRLSLSFYFNLRRPVKHKRYAKYFIFWQSLFRILYMDKRKERKRENWIKEHLSAFSELMSPGMTELKYLMLKLLLENLILGLEQCAAQTG